MAETILGRNPGFGKQERKERGNYLALMLGVSFRVKAGSQNPAQKLIILSTEKKIARNKSVGFSILE